MVLKSDNYIKAIEQEIQWCKDNRDKGIYEEGNDKLNEMCQNAFIKGLEQAILIIKQLRVLR